MKTGIMLLSVWLLSISAHSRADEPWYRIETLNKRLQWPWALVQLPDERWLVTERGGHLVLVGGGQRAKRFELALPELYVAGQGGLMDIKLDPNFHDNQRLWVTFAMGQDKQNRLAVATARFTEDAITDVNVVFRSLSVKDTPVHYGGRLLNLPDGSWLLTSGDGFDYREQAQVRTSHLGKVLRFLDDGRSIQTPPWADAPYLFSMGHRNPQAIVWDDKQQRVWLHEHGPAGGDELNLLQAGNNYGWPLVTQGKDYSGANITPFQDYPNTVAPVVNWTPSVAPSGMVLYQHHLFTTLQDKLLISTLKAQQLLAVSTRAPFAVEPLFDTLRVRLRDVAVGNDGAIYVITDEEEARLLRISPH